MFPESFDPNDEAAGEGLFGLPSPLHDARLIVIPVPFDATASYRRGAANGPQAVLEASWQVDLRDVETGDPWREGFAMLEPPPWIREANQSARDAADVIQRPELSRAQDVTQARAQVDHTTTRVMEWVEQQAHYWLDRERIVAVLGGDHSTPLGSILAHAKRHPNMAVLHVDAHADLRPSYQGFEHSHASIMHNVLAHTPRTVKLVQVGIRDLCQRELDVIANSPARIRTFFDHNLKDALLEGTKFSDLAGTIVEALPEEVYVSFDIDGLEPHLCPHTGTPVPGGLSFSQATYLLKRLVESGRRIVGFDLCEVAPGPGDEVLDALVGARVLYKLAGWTLRSRGTE